MSEESAHQVPHGDLDYAVENALWVADATREIGLLTRPYMTVFCTQLEAHWRELRAFHGVDLESAESVSPTEQTAFGGVTDE